MKGLRRILDHLPGVHAGFDAPLAPDAPFIAIGDIHGRLDLLERILEILHMELPGKPLVFVGDYIDRGPDAAGVLQHLRQFCLEREFGAICLMGNHERMMLDFLDHPETSGKLWLVNGGGQTLQSFGVESPEPDASPEAMITASSELKRAMGAGVLDWLNALPLTWRSGNVVAAHAGPNPEKPIEDRRSHGILWGHPEFFAKHRQDGLWVLHGHYILPTPISQNGRISIDTGAFHTGVLTAAIVEPDGVRFAST